MYVPISLRHLWMSNIQNTRLWPHQLGMHLALSNPHSISFNPQKAARFQIKWKQRPLQSQEGEEKL